MATLSKKVLNELAAEEAARQAGGSDRASSVVSPDAEQQEESGSPRFSHAPYGYHAVPAQYRTINASNTGASTPPEQQASSGLMNPFATSENNNNSTDDASYLYSAGGADQSSSSQSRVVTQVTGSGHSFSSFKHLSPQTVAKLNRNHHQQSSSPNNGNSNNFVDPMSHYKQSSTQHESNADAASSYLMNTSANSGSNSHSIHGSPSNNNSPNHSIRGGSPNSTQQQQQQQQQQGSSNMNSYSQQPQQPVFVRRGFSLRHQVAQQQVQDEQQNQQQHTVVDSHAGSNKPSSPTSGQAPPSYGETISTTTPVAVYNNNQQNDADSSSAAPSPSGPGPLSAISNDSGVFTHNNNEMLGSSYNSNSVPPSPMTLGASQSNNRSFSYGGSAPQIPPALAIAHLGGSFSAPSAATCGTPTPNNNASLKRTLSNASVKTTQSHAESSAVTPDNNQGQQQRKKKNKNNTAASIDGSSPSTPSKPRMDVNNPNFKAHVGLEQHGVPYFSFPNGGALPKPAHWPAHCTIDAVGDAPSHRAFIGQVRFETTAEQIAFIIEAVTGVTVSFIANHRNGCFVAHFRTAEDCQTAVDQHKMILFDLHGVWQMQKDDEGHKTAVQAVLKNKSVLHRYRLPRGCMVIEHFTSSRNSSGVPDANAAPRQPTVPVYQPNHTMNHHQQQQQQQHMMMMSGMMMHHHQQGFMQQQGMMMMAPPGYNNNGLGSSASLGGSAPSYLFGASPADAASSDVGHEVQTSVSAVNAFGGTSTWVEGEDFEASEYQQQ